MLVFLFGAHIRTGTPVLIELTLGAGNNRGACKSSSRELAAVGLQAVLALIAPQ